jgi:putative transposase
MNEGSFYHIFNRGNNKEKIFYNRENYLFFLRKTRKYILPHFEILAYCLMPNHFHFLTYCEDLDLGKSYAKDLSTMLRSYSRAINIQENRVGSLFQKRTKIKLLNPTLGNSFNKNIIEYPFVCFHYIHQNPIKAGLVSLTEEWEFSSYLDYAGLRNGTLVNKKLGIELLNVPENPETFVQQSLDVKLY